MPLVLVQSQAYASSTTLTTHSITLNSIPTSGNLLIFAVVSDTTVTGTPSGWSVVASAVDFTGTYMYYRVAGTATPSTFSVTLSATDTCTLQVFEYSGNTASPLDKSATAIGQGTESVNTGTTATTTQADELVFALVGITGSRVGSGVQPASDVSSWSNGFVQIGNAVTTVVPASGTDIRGVAATLSVNATGTYTTTATLVTTTVADNSGIIATFKAAATVGPTIGSVPSGAALTTPAFTAKFLYFDTGDYGIGV